MIFEKPVLYALIASHMLLAGVAVHYKLRYSDADKKYVAQVAQTQVWKDSAANLTAGVATQNRALELMKSEQTLKDAQSALALDKAHREAEDARTRAKAITARQKPLDVPACTAAGSLFDEVVHGND